MTIFNVGNYFFIRTTMVQITPECGLRGCFLFGSRQSGALKPVPFCTAFGRLAVNREKWKKMKSATLIHA